MSGKQLLINKLSEILQENIAISPVEDLTEACEEIIKFFDKIFDMYIERHIEIKKLSETVSLEEKKMASKLLGGGIVKSTKGDYIT
jgi:hypothetical protein